MADVLTTPEMVDAAETDKSRPSPIPVPIDHDVTPTEISAAESDLRSALAQPGALTPEQVQDLYVQLAILLTAQQQLLGFVLAPIGATITQLHDSSESRLANVIDAVAAWFATHQIAQDQRLGQVTNQVRSYLTSSLAERTIQLASVPGGHAVPTLTGERLPGTTRPVTTTSGLAAGTPATMRLWTDLSAAPPQGAAANAVGGPYSSTGMVYAWVKPETGETFGAWFPSGTSPERAAVPDSPADLSTWTRHGPLSIDRFTWGVADPQVQSIWPQLPAVLQVQRAVPIPGVSSATTGTGADGRPVPAVQGVPPAGTVVSVPPPGSVLDVPGDGIDGGGGGGGTIAPPGPVPPGPGQLAGGCCPPVDFPDLLALSFWPGAESWRQSIVTHTPGLAEVIAASDMDAVDVLSRERMTPAGRSHGLTEIVQGDTLPLMSGIVRAGA